MIGLLAIAPFSAAGPITRVDVRPTGSDLVEYSPPAAEPAAYQLCMDCAFEARAQKLADLEIGDILPRLADATSQSVAAIFRNVISQKAEEPERPRDNSLSLLEGICGFVMIAAPVLFRAAAAIPLRPPR